jgi:hypothetical protein
MADRLGNKKVLLPFGSGELKYLINQLEIELEYHGYVLKERILCLFSEASF